MGIKLNIWSRDPDHAHIGAILCTNFVITYKKLQAIYLMLYKR